MALPAPRPLLVLLLLILFLELSRWDSLSCNCDTLTVPRGQWAMMCCSMSTPLTHVVIRLHAPGEASELIFVEDGPGHFSNNGWQLGVRNGEARLVIPDAQPAQAGEYTWFLVGTNESVTHTTSLNVSEPPVTEAAPTPPTGTQPPPPASTVSPVPVLPAVIVPILVLAMMAVLIALAWRRRHRSRNLGRIRQMQMSLVQSPGPESGAEQGRLAPGMQPEEPRPPQSLRHQRRTHDASPDPQLLDASPVPRHQSCGLSQVSAIEPGARAPLVDLGGPRDPGISPTSGPQTRGWRRSSRLGGRRTLTPP